MIFFFFTFPLLWKVWSLNIVFPAVPQRQNRSPDSAMGVFWCPQRRPGRNQRRSVIDRFLTGTYFNLYKAEWRNNCGLICSGLTGHSDRLSRAIRCKIMYLCTIAIWTGVRTAENLKNWLGVSTHFPKISSGVRPSSRFKKKKNHTNQL